MPKSFQDEIKQNEGLLREKLEERAKKRKEELEKGCEEKSKSEEDKDGEKLLKIIGDLKQRWQKGGHHDGSDNNEKPYGGPK